ncbi:MAG: Smr/MutS family protein [Flavobacteriales bacterium]|jgi:predicted transcriptional regulator
MEFKIGDRVRFLNDAGEGKIVDFPRAAWALVEDASGFAFEHPISELVTVIDPRKELRGYEMVTPTIQDLLDRNIDKGLVKKAADDFKVIYKNKNASSEKRRGETLEVDLHIHEILDRHHGMSNSEIVAVQIEHFERMLKSAEENRISRVIFIHGVGQGVLRAELRKLLNDYYPHCEFHDAPYSEYGYGATEVRIRTSSQRNRR